MLRCRYAEQEHLVFFQSDLNVIEENCVVLTGKGIFPTFSYCGSQAEEVIEAL